ncbi:ankyrin repeat domain-containing protein [Sphingobacterium faecale]|uniref:Ankyrin repeat domain-containing protein n=1 Tax=Sphingobacterium faecale TaxID=2803775 RepID=A0ABS1QZN2_9SPHI|nr:ankyrin repeat domain-containing protein [Sphingobacterium faecale]MBL1407670.1 ankyrin repeat domain-containing protein [Sphingobacterium faecale]
MSSTIIEEYIETGNHQDLELLLSQDSSLVHQKTSHDISPLLLSCYYHKPQVTQVILKFITTITIHEACATGLLQHIQMMIEHKKEVVNERSDHGFTPLGIAAHFGKEDVVRLLLLHHANPNIASQNGYNTYPLHASLAANHVGITKMLIESGAEVNVLQYGGIAPLHLAAQHGNIDLIINLLEQGADITQLTNTGQSASDLAVDKGFTELADILKI